MVEVETSSKSLAEIIRGVEEEVKLKEKHECVFCGKEVIAGDFIVEERLRPLAKNEKQLCLGENPWGGINGIPTCYEGAVVCYKCHDEMLEDEENMVNGSDDNDYDDSDTDRLYG